MLSLAENIFSDWELKFLGDIVQQAEDTLALTRKEREKLKDSTRLDEARVELDEDDEAFIERLWRSGVAELPTMISHASRAAASNWASWKSTCRRGGLRPRFAM
jgi:hypothetical protein